MALFVTTCPKFLALLGTFYEALDHSLSLDAELVSPEEVPEPYRQLLVHRRDMTPTLEQYHGEQVELEVLQRWTAGEHFFRHIALVGVSSGRPVEYGAIRIDLGALDDAARRQVLECRVPLGRILASLGITHQGCPGGFFRILSNALISRVLRIEGPQRLYGRCNCLTDAAGRTIAEVIEIMPPLPQRGAHP